MFLFYEFPENKIQLIEEKKDFFPKYFEYIPC